MTSTQDTRDQARQTASTAADEGKHVAGVVGDEARNVTGQAKDQVRGLLDEAMGQVDEQTRGQRDRLVGTLQDLSNDLEEMAGSGGSGLAAQLTRQVAETSRTLSSHLDGREPTDLLDDVRRFARRRPAVFLLGALGAGVVVGRLARGAKQAQDSEPAASSPTIAPSPTSAPSYGQQEIAAPPSPHGDPLYADAGIDGEHDDGSASGTGPQGFLP